MLFRSVILVVVFGIFFKNPEVSIRVTNGTTENTSASLTEEIHYIIRKRHWLITSEEGYSSVLQRHPLIAKATASKSLLKNLSVHVEMKSPMAAIKSGEIFIMIDSQGVVLEIASDIKAPYVIHGFSIKASEVGAPIVTESEALIVKAVQLVDLYQRYSDIKPDVELIEGELIQKISPRLWVNFGKGHDIANQFNEAMSIYDDMATKKSTTGIINLSVPGQTVIQTWKN